MHSKLKHKMETCYVLTRSIYLHTDKTYCKNYYITLYSVWFKRRQSEKHSIFSLSQYSRYLTVVNVDGGPHTE